MQPKVLLLPLLLAPVLAACSDHGGSASGQYVSFVGDTVVVKTPSNPDARVSANGDLAIGNNAVAVNPSQRALLKRYYRQVLAVRDDGIATGKEGAALGMHAISSAVNNLVAGTPERIDQDINARGKVVDATAQRMCGDLGRLKATQGELVALLPAFRPFAVFGDGISYFGGDMQCDDDGNRPPPPPVPPVPPQPPKASSPPSNSASTR
ncbi:MAG: hypothetical protein ACTHMO_08020 [Rhodanobacteraceae bacterium]